MITGWCKCASCVLAIDADAPLQVYVCHCLDCQTASGSAFGQHALIPEDALECDGPIATVELGARHDVYCARCLTRIYNTRMDLSGLVVLRAGFLSQSGAIMPVAHMWASRKQAWVRIPDGIRVWEETPCPADFAATLER